MTNFRELVEQYALFGDLGSNALVIVHGNEHTLGCRKRETQARRYIGGGQITSPL